jgi:hypothetical protein
MQQSRALHWVFVRIASLFLFTAKTDMQSTAATALARGFRVFLPAADPPPGADDTIAALRNVQLQLLIAAVAPLVVDSMDELHLYEMIRETLTASPP